jgi:hypothetical protein
VIRRDYLLRQIEQFVAALAKMAGLAKNEQWQEASTVAGSQFQQLIGMDAAELLRLSDTELLARLIQGEATLPVENKIFMLATLFKANADLVAAQGRLEESRPYYLKGLHLLLHTVAHDELAERPDFVPTIEAFLVGLGDSPLPLNTSVILMRHYEQASEFAKAEDTLFTMLDSEPANVELLDFGIVFYQRLLGLSDDALAVGNLPCEEVKAGLVELEKRKAGIIKPA